MANAVSGGHNASAGQVKQTPRTTSPRVPEISSKRTKGAGVMKERVSRSPGVKPIERRAPPRPAVKRKSKADALAPMARGVNSGKSSKSKIAIIFAITLALVAAVGAAVYFSGIWKRFLE